MLEFNNRKFYDTEIYFLMHAYQLVERNPGDSKIELFYLLHDELDELDMFDENSDDIAEMYICLNDFIDLEFEFLKSLM